MLKEQEISFPVEWSFRIICDCKIDVSDGLCAVLKSFGINEAPKIANQSSGGKYQSFSVKATFQDKPSMDLMANQLRSVNGVKIVL
jgi:putative lipoic acid-binding regulatory protein